jgi:polysaccharide biosynthesis protein PslH
MPDLLVSSHTPVLRSGRAMRTYGIVRALAHGGHRVGFVYVRFGADGPDDTFASIPGVEFHEVIPSRGVRRLLAYADARRRGVPDALARGVSHELGTAASALAERYGGRVIADGPTEAAAVARLAARRSVIYNAHNIESAFRGEFDVDSLGDPARLRRFERDLLARSAETWVVSAADARSARELFPEVVLRVIPNVVDVASIRPQPPDPDARRILLVGNFGYEPNRLGLRFLLDEVLPLVWRSVPEARLRIVGAGLDGERFSDPRVQALGFVDEIESAYQNVSCVAVPLLQSGGSPVKFVEAMAYGLPVVATERACAGLTVRDGEHCLIATGAGAFADALVDVLTEGRPELGVRARELVEAQYSIATISELIRA